MKLLVIGGSYFYGRVFVMQAAGEHEVTVVNRGTYSMAELGVKEIRGDRKDENLWKAIREDYDAIIDFCAYEKGDIAGVLRNTAGKVRQYIFISTVDVYRRGMQGRKATGMREEKERVWKEAEVPEPDGADDEERPFETRIFPGEAGQYIAGKVALEREVRVECAERGIPYTVLRPAILYGPFNYAPREPLYIRMMVQNHVLPHVKETKGSFQMVYVKDAASAVMKCLLNEKAYGQAYNLCQSEIVTYDSFYEALKDAAVGQDEFSELPVTADGAAAMGIPLPFPVTAEESEICSNERSRRELGMEYLSFSEGMARTYRALRNVYGGN